MPWTEGDPRSVCLVCEEGVEEEFLHKVPPARGWAGRAQSSYDTKNAHQ